MRLRERRVQRACTLRGRFRSCVSSVADQRFNPIEVIQCIRVREASPGPGEGRIVPYGLLEVIGGALQALRRALVPLRASQSVESKCLKILCGPGSDSALVASPECATQRLGYSLSDIRLESEDVRHAPLIGLAPNVRAV